MRKTCGWLLAAAATIAGGALAGNAEATPRVLTEFVSCEEHPRNSEGDVVKLHNGHLLVVYSQFYKDAKAAYADGKNDHASARIVLTESSDGGRTWSPSRIAAERGADDLNVMSASFLRLGNGDLALFYLVKHATDDCRPVMRVSRDEGATWAPAVRCVGDGAAGYYVMNNARAIRLATGRILLPLARHARKGETRLRSGADLMCAISDDEGATWRLSADARNGGETELQEPGLLPLADGRLMMYARTNRRHQWRILSSDGGEHWSQPEPIAGYATPCHAPVTYTRLGNGDLALVFNDASGFAEPPRRYEPRQPMTLGVSKDDGRTWRFKNLENVRPGLYCCYFAMREIDGRLVLVYCERDTLCTSRVAEVPLAWLYDDSAKPL